MQIGANTANANTFVGVSTLVTPAANTTGLEIRTASLCISGGSAGSLMIKTSAPASYSDTTAIHLLDIVGDNGVFATDIFVPAGYGVYAGMAASSPANGAYITYDVVS